MTTTTITSPSTNELPVCEGDSWHGLTFTQHAVNISSFLPVNEWTLPYLRSYVYSNVVPRDTASIAFVALAVVLVLIFLLWRVVRCSCIQCCGHIGGSRPSQDVVKSRRMIVIKVAVFLLGAGVAAAAIYGLVFPKGSTVQDGWDAADNIKNYTQQVVNALDLVVSTLRSTQASVNSASLTLTSSSQIPSSPQKTQMVDDLQSVNSSIGSILSILPTNINRLQQDVVVAISNAAASNEGQTLNAWTISVDACMGAFGAAILVVLLIWLASALNCGWGVAVATTLQLLLALLFFVAAAALAGGLIVCSDGCTNMEVIVVQAVPSNLKPLASFYVDPSSLPSDLESVLAQANLINVTQVTDEIKNPIQQLNNETQQLLLDPLLTPTERATITNTSRNLATNLQALLAAVGNASSSNSSDTASLGVLGLARLQQIQPLYISAKQYVCCEVPGLTAELWTLLTVLGWLGLGIAVAAAAVLRELDQTLDSGPCCSCSCLRAVTMPPAGKPIDVAGPQQLFSQPVDPHLQAEPLVQVRIRRGEHSTGAAGFVSG